MSTEQSTEEVEPEYCEHGKELGTGPTCRKCETPTANERIEPCTRCQAPGHTKGLCCSSCLHNVTRIRS